MKFATSIDFGAFIWDEDLFKENQSLFYPILDFLPKLLTAIVNSRTQILFRPELYEEIKSNFPHNLIPADFRDFRSTVIRLTGKLNTLEYSSEKTNLTISPNLVKEYFSISTKDEIEFLINYIYNNDFYSMRYITFSSIWDFNNQIEVSNGEVKLIDVDLADNIEDLNEYSKCLKKRFEHNPKHKKVDTYFKGKKRSKLRCFDGRKKESSIYVQNLLDEAVEINGWFYSYDKKHNVFIRFLRTERNIYHAFEDSPTKDIIDKFNAIQDGE